MVAKSSVVASALAIAVQLQAVNAVCFKFGVGPFGGCNVDPRAPERFQAYLNFDNADATCNDGGIFDASLVYNDAEGNPKKAAAISSTSVASAVSTVAPFNFAVANTNIKAGQAATIYITGYNAALAAPFTTSVLYTPAAAPSVAYATRVATFTAYTTVQTPITLSSTVTRYATVTPGYLKPVTIKTDVATATVQPLSTTVSVIQPVQITSTSWAPQSTVTSTYSCDPLATDAPRRFNKRKFFEATYSAPFCAAVTTTSIYNAAKTVTSVATSTMTNTNLAIATTTSTITAAAGKTKFAGTITSTSTSSLPVRTITMYSKGKRATTYTVSTRTKTVWVQPTASGSGVCKAGAATYTAGTPISTSA